MYEFLRPYVYRFDYFTIKGEELQLNHLLAGIHIA